MYNATLNRQRWESLTIKPARLAEVTDQARWIISNRARYETVQRLTGVPWWFIGALHAREAPRKTAFQCYLGNGQSLKRKTTLAPKGRGPFATWEAGAVDALCIQKFNAVRDWSIEHVLYLAEEYNGMGYAAHGLTSPYVWGATNYQQAGKYVADGKFEASVWDQQIGVAAVLQVVMGLLSGVLPTVVNSITGSTQNPTAGVTVAPVATSTNLLGVIVGALMAGIGGAGFGADGIHTITTIAGVLVSGLSAINHLHLVNTSNNNTITYIEELLAQIAAYNPPTPEVSDVVKSV
jgi:lysozyme family protein